MLSLNRSGLNYRHREADATNALLMRRLDELYTEHPFLGYRKLTVLLRTEGHTVNAKRVYGTS